MRQTLSALLTLAAIGVLVGCGGSGGSASADAGGPPAPAPELPKVGSAKFKVDTRTNSVEITPLGSDGRAAYTGTALGFSSNTLLTEGSPARKVIRATLFNQTSEALGNPEFKVLFSDFKNLNTAPTDLRPVTKAITVAGSGVSGTGDGPATTATLLNPRSLSYDPADEALYFMDNSGKVRQLEDGVVTTRAEATGVSLSGGGVAVRDVNFGLVTGSNRVFTMNSSSTLNQLAGDAAAGNVDASLGNSRFNNPQGVFITDFVSASNFKAFIADTGNGSVRLLDRSLGTVNTIISGLNSPVGVVQGVGGAIFVSESGGNRIHVQLGSVSAKIGTGLAGSVNGPGNTAAFSSPRYLAFIDRTLYIADFNNNMIRTATLKAGGSPIQPADWSIAVLSGSSTLGGFQDGTGNVLHSGPTGLASANVVFQGNQDFLFVSDTLNNRVRLVTPTGFRFPVGLTDGSANPTDVPSLANAEGFAPSLPIQTPYIVEPALIAAGGNRILGDWKFVVPEGVSAFEFVVTVEAEPSAPGSLPSVGNTGPAVAPGSPNVLVRGFSGGVGNGFADGTVSGAAYNRPGDICFDSEGNAFVADTFNHCVRRIDIDGTVTTIAGRPSAPGSLDGLSSVNTLNLPQGIACNPEGTEVFVAERGHAIRRVSFFLRDDNVDPADNDIKLRESWRVDTIAGLAGTLGTVDNTTGNTARFNNPFGVAWVSPTTIYVSEVDGNRIRSITRTGPTFTSLSYTVTTVAGSSAGTAGFLDSTDPSLVRFNKPTNIGLSPSGILYVADTLNQRVRKVLPGGATSTLAGTGSAGYRDTIGGAPLFSNPTDVTVDSAGYVYVVESVNRLIRRVSPLGVTTTVAGGPGGAGTNDGNGATARFTLPFSLAVRPTGELYVIDGGRIRLIQRLITN